jgi:hypothetical protein
MNAKNSILIHLAAKRFVPEPDTKMTEEFEDIRFFNDEEVRGVLGRIVSDRQLIGSIRKLLLPNCPSLIGVRLDSILRTYLKMKLRPIRSIDQFQRRITRDMVLSRVVDGTTDGLTFAGLEHLDRGISYIFVTTHRDIALDAAFLNYVLSNNGFNIPAIACGDNLLVNQLASDIIRVNKSFVVKRRVPPEERQAARHQLSRYISYLQDQRESVWIAQREGRSKDGDDRTNPALIHMLYMAQQERGMSFEEYILSANIVPVAISYEKDPCDVVKAKELSDSAKNEDPGRGEKDLKSLYLGLMRHKGRVRISFGEPLRGDYHDEVEVAESIDRTIHRIYKLWPTNYIAYDELTGSVEYITEYSPGEREAFLARFAGETDEIRRQALAMYAQPVINRRALEVREEGRTELLENSGEFFTESPKEGRL